MNSSDTRTSDTRTSTSSVIDVNFIGQGLKALKALREKNLLNLSQDSLPNAGNLLIKSQQNPENYYAHPPDKPRPRTGFVRRKQETPREPQEPNYKQIFLNSDRVLKINSVNCGFKILNDNFYKVQISEVADPLINEVVFSIELTEAMKNNPNNPNKINIFPIYKDHFTLTKDELSQNNVNQQYIKKNNNYKVLVTEALDNPSSLYDIIKSAKTARTGMSLISDKINILMTQYKYYGEKLGFIHSDLHMNNIQVDQDDNYKIIDFGRCFMFDEETKKQKYLNETNSNKNIFEKFNIKKNLDFSNPFRLENLIDNTKISESNIHDRYICKQYAYLCDVAQVSFNLLLTRIIPNKQWFTIIKYNNCNESYIQIDLKLITNHTALSMLDHGLLWLISYLISCVKNIYKIQRIQVYNTYENRKKNLNQIFGKKIILNDGTKFVYQFDLTNTMDKTLLISNGMFNPFVFSKNHNVQLDTIKFYEIIKTETISGGFTKKLKINSSIYKNKSKMRGGITLTNFQNAFNFQNPDIITYINQINEKDQIIDNLEFELKQPLPLPLPLPLEIPEYYEASEEQIKNLGKSVYQIFFEELEKQPELFNQFFEKKECEPCAIPDQACKPCQSSPLITTRTRPSSSCNWPPTSTVLPIQTATRGGGKSYMIHHCKETKRKYIRKSNTRWYLDENRGKYKYLNPEKTRIVLRN